MNRYLRMLLFSTLLPAPVLFAQGPEAEAPAMLARLQQGPLKDLKPETQEFSFQEGEGFSWRCVLKRKFSYTLVTKIGYDAKTKQLEDRTAEFIQLKKFIADMESDSRGRLILENNTSGLPAFITIEHHDGIVAYHLHHPLHDIQWEPTQKNWSYGYAGPLTVFAHLPEIKRAQSEPSVRALVAASPVDIRVGGSGSPLTFFDCVFTREGVAPIKVRVQRGAVSVLGKE